MYLLAALGKGVFLDLAQQGPRLHCSQLPAWHLRDAQGRSLVSFWTEWERDLISGNEIFCNSAFSILMNYF